MVFFNIDYYGTDILAVLPQPFWAGGHAAASVPDKKDFPKLSTCKAKKGDALSVWGDAADYVFPLKAGYSMENAFLQSWEEYAKLYGQKSLMAQEFRNIIYQMKLNEPLEQLVEDFALRSGIEEISSFSQVFSFAKRGGGDMRKIFQDTVEKIRQKSDVEREITTVVTAKKMEQRIMDLVPFGILFYVGATSPEFLAPLYGNALGACIMTICLLVYAGAFLLAEKILDIHV